MWNSGRIYHSFVTNVLKNCPKTNHNEYKIFPDSFMHMHHSWCLKSRHAVVDRQQCIVYKVLLYSLRENMDIFVERYVNDHLSTSLFSIIKI